MEARKYICILILFVINLLNYMDRFTIAGVLNDVSKFYEIDDQMAGFLQTVFVVFFMLFAPICGFLGDRFNRKWIIMCGEIVWVAAVLASSFIPADYFWAFVLLRGVVGIGEASYAVIAPTMIADMFAGKMRSRILMVFYFAIPVGSGLGYVVGSLATNIAKGGQECPDCWQWGIRSTPIIGLISLIALILGVDEPVRGRAEIEEYEAMKSAEKSQQNTTTAIANHEDEDDDTSQQDNDTSHEDDGTIQRDDGTIRQDDGTIHEDNGIHIHEEWNDTNQRSQNKQNLMSDLIYLAKNATFIWSTIGYTAVVFVTGTLSWWSPAAIEHAIAWHQSASATDQNMTTDQNLTSTSMPHKSQEEEQAALNFGIVTCLAGIVGVAVGSVIAMAWKHGKWVFAGHSSPKADPLISAIGSFLATPLLFLSLKMIEWDIMIAAWIGFFFTIVGLCLNWAVNVDMLMSIIVPQRRSIATAVQILISHAFGDASGPWIVGAISDWVRGPDQSPKARFNSLMVAFYLPNILLLISGIAFLVSVFTLPHAIRQIEEWRKTNRVAQN